MKFLEIPEVEIRKWCLLANVAIKGDIYSNKNNTGKLKYFFKKANRLSLIRSNDKNNLSLDYYRNYQKL